MILLLYSIITMCILCSLLQSIQINKLLKLLVVNKKTDKNQINYEWFNKKLPLHILTEKDAMYFLDFSYYISNNICNIKKALEQLSHDEVLDIKLRIASLNLEYTRYKAAFYDKLTIFIAYCHERLSKDTIKLIKDWMEKDLNESRDMSFLYLEFAEYLGE